MHDTTVKFKNGKILCAPLWYFRPVEGFFSLAGENSTLYYFRDVESMITSGERTGLNKIEDQDELERARREGWNGK